MSSRVTIGQHSTWKRGLSIALAASLIVAQLPAVARAAETTPTAAVGGLSVSSDPAGAAVYVDGKLAGQTPATIPALSAGDHRVRVVKDGYLENGRIVSVTAGQSKALDVKLTKYDGSATASSAMAATGGGGSFLTSPLFLAAVAGGVIVAFLVLKKGKPPIPGTISAPTAGIQGAGVAVSSTGASSPSNAALEYQWDCGGGTATGTGASITCTFSSTGSFTIKLTVKDKNGSAAAPSVTVTIKSITGTWQGPIPGITGLLPRIVVTQSGSTFSGTYSDGFFTGTISGTLSATSPTVKFTVNSASFLPYRFEGAPGTTADTLVGNAIDTGLPPTPWTLTRQ